jgi:hypothetical protein
MDKNASYDIFLDTRHWAEAQDIFGVNKTVQVRAFVSTMHIEVSHSWMHHVEVHDPSGTLQGLVLYLMQQDCSQLQVFRNPYGSFLLRLATMIPLFRDLGTRAMRQQGYHEPALTICMGAQNVVRIAVPRSEKSNHSRAYFSDQEEGILTWLEEDKCGDTIRYYVSTNNMLAAGGINSVNMSLQRVLISPVCALTQNPFTCHENDQTMESNARMSIHVASLKFCQWHDSLDYHPNLAIAEEIVGAGVCKGICPAIVARQDVARLQ